MAKTIGICDLIVDPEYTEQCLIIDIPGAQVIKPFSLANIIRTIGNNPATETERKFVDDEHAKILKASRTRKTQPYANYRCVLLTIALLRRVPEINDLFDEPLNVSYSKLHTLSSLEIIHEYNVKLYDILLEEHYSDAAHMNFTFVMSYLHHKLHG